MKMEIIVKILSNYGNEAIYPVNEAAKKFAEIAGTKTMSRKLLNQCKELGFSVGVEQVSL